MSGSLIVRVVLARERREHSGGFDMTIHSLLNHRSAREDARAPERLDGYAYCIELLIVLSILFADRAGM